MIQFFKDSFRELKHVVWPTKEETKNFFTIVLVVLLSFGIYLFVFSTIFSEAMIAFRQFIQSL